LIFKVRGNLALGGDIEIGRAMIPLSVIASNERGQNEGVQAGGVDSGTSTSEETVAVEVDVVRKRSKRIVGSLIVEVGFLALDH
jgi:hypothetical protein